MQVSSCRVSSWLSLRSPAVRQFLWIPLLAAGGQLALFWSVYATRPNNIFLPDSASYIQTANAFVRTGHIAKSQEQSELPQLVRTPGYPFFLACFFFIFDEQYAPIVYAQIALSAYTILLTTLLAWKLWQDQKIALLAAMLLTIDISSAIASQQILTETLFTFFFTLSLWMGSAAFAKNSSVWRIGLFGFLLAVATLIRPITYYLIIPISLLVLFNLRFQDTRRTWKKALFSVLLLLFPWFVLIGGWHLRNFLVAGTSEFSTIQSVNLLFYRGADIIARRDGISFEAAREQLGYSKYAQIHPKTKDWTEAQLARAWKQEGFDLIRRYPAFALKSQVNGLIKLLFDPGESTVFAYLGKKNEPTGPGRDFFTLPFETFADKWVKEKSDYLFLFAFAAGYLLLIYAGVITTIWQRFQRSIQPLNIRHLLPITMFVYVIAISAGPEAYSRFRIPVMPILCLYAAKGMVSWFLIVRNNSVKRLS